MGEKYKGTTACLNSLPDGTNQVSQRKGVEHSRIQNRLERTVNERMEEEEGKQRRGVTAEIGIF